MADTFVFFYSGRVYDVYTKTLQYSHHLSVVNYGILWEWMLSSYRQQAPVLRRYDAIVLDEFFGLDKKREFLVRWIFEQLKEGGILKEGCIIVACSASLEPAYFKAMSSLGDDDFSFLRVDERRFSLERCMVVAYDQQ